MQWTRTHKVAVNMRDTAVPFLLLNHDRFWSIKFSAFDHRESCLIGCPCDTRLRKPPITVRDSRIHTHLWPEYARLSNQIAYPAHCPYWRNTQPGPSIGNMCKLSACPPQLPTTEVETVRTLARQHDWLSPVALIVSYIYKKCGELPVRIGKTLTFSKNFEKN